MIKNHVNYYRRLRGLSQGQLSRLANVDEKSIQRLSHDPYAYCSTETLDKIADALGVDVSRLISSVNTDLSHDHLPPPPAPPSTRTT